MLPTLTTYIVLAAIAIQGVFGGLQESVSICLGGGHAHEVEAVVEHCEFECAHHSTWPTPITSREDIDNCDCTDLELGLIVLLTTTRVQDSVLIYTPALFTIVPFVEQNNSQSWRGPPQYDDDLGMMQRIAVIRSTRLRV
jgi:hypothetical protein